MKNNPSVLYPFHQTCHSNNHSQSHLCITKVVNYKKKKKSLVSPNDPVRMWRKKKDRVQHEMQPKIEKKSKNATENAS
jgi:hypothetical protein